ncbi:GH39 family glycosyl hydrolase [Olsenella profusa]|uniref:Glycoside hydrolase, family 39 n=1 Tax=Olsenella profusa F0195 TaxID=1125712 RepID=U2TCC1_9ACTN|nr:helix-turn-helix domain-containing protein [Olsenella profusa]ERL10699.1 glycoside hydrolase, family 39 [Olsenella profusa F0195]
MFLQNLDFSIVRAKTGVSYAQTNLFVFFVLEGRMTVRYREEDISLAKDDVLLVAPGMGCMIRKSQDALYGVASFPMELIHAVIGSQHIVLYANSVRDASHAYADLREVFNDLIAEYTSDTNRTHALRDSLLLKLLNTLIENYQLSFANVGEVGDDASNDARMEEAIRYVLNNLTTNITLSRLARSMYISPSTLSRLFKHGTGINFTEYVSRLRVQMSLELLESSDKNLTEIALACGFSSPVTFNRAFHKVMGTSPSGFRKTNRQNAKQLKQQRQKDEREVRRELVEKGYRAPQSRHQEDLLLDIERTHIERHACLGIINMGNIADIMQIQQHVLHLHKNLHFRYFRIWNIFSRSLKVSDGMTFGSYNFYELDTVLDFFVTNNLKPYICLGRRPNMALKSLGNNVFYMDDCVQFVSKRIWADCLSSLLDEMVNRYGLTEVSTWIFEFDRDYDHDDSMESYAGDPFDFFDAWKTAYRIVHEKVPGALFGGISGEVVENYSFLKRFYQRCIAEHCAPDFASFLLFPYFSGSGDKQRRRICPDVSFVKLLVEKMRSLMDESGMGGRRLFISEFNSSISNRNYLNDSCMRAAWTIEAIRHVDTQVDCVCLMAGSDWISNYSDASCIIEGKIGLLSQDGIRKPVYFAIDFLNQLGERLIAQGDNYVATLQDNGDIYILCFYYAYPQAIRNLTNENIGLNECISYHAVGALPLTLNFAIEHLCLPGEYCVKKRVIDTSHGDVVGEWRKFQFERHLTTRDVDYLRAVCCPCISIDRKTVDSRKRLWVQTTLKPNSIVSLHIYRHKK